MGQFAEDASSRAHCVNQILSADGNFTYITDLYNSINTNYTAALGRINFVPTIYDETTYFKNAHDYPFQNRKIEMPLAVGEKLPRGQVYNHNIFLKKNQACYDVQWYSELLFWREDEYCDI